MVMAIVWWEGEQAILNELSSSDDR
jgi:hypothetical protein